MYRMSVHITKKFNTVAEVEAEYEEIRGEVVHHEGLTFSCNIATSLPEYSPESPNGREVPS